MKKEVAIIGYGFVGQGMHKIFPDALIYDPAYKKSITKEVINQECGLAIVCVPTPPRGMGEQKVNPDEKEFLEADLSILVNTIKWLKTDLILIKSTVPPNTTKTLNKVYKKRICFSPEYMGEGNYYTPPKYPHPTNPLKHSFMIVGGAKKDCEDVLSFFYPKTGPAKKYLICSPTEAELVKYMENTWGAMKVTFCNEWYEICKKFGGSYEIVREGLLLDSRTEAMHTAVFKNKRGFGGKCYPKDLLAIIGATEKKGYNPELLKQVWETNKKIIKK